MNRTRAVLCAWACLLLAASGLAQAVDAGSSSAPAQHLLLLIESNKGSYTIVGRRELQGALPRALPRASQQGWSYQALDAEGAVLHTGALPNPQLLRGEFKDPDTGATTGTQLSTSEAVTFSIRVPVESKTVVLYGVPLPIESSTRALRSAPSNRGQLARIAL